MLDWRSEEKEKRCTHSRKVTDNFKMMMAALAWKSRRKLSFMPSKILLNISKYCTRKKVNYPPNKSSSSRSPIPTTSPPSWAKRLDLISNSADGRIVKKQFQRFSGKPNLIVLNFTSENLNLLRDLPPRSRTQRAKSGVAQLYGNASWLSSRELLNSHTYENTTHSIQSEHVEFG